MEEMKEEITEELSEELSEEITEEKKDGKKKKVLASQTSLTIRVVVGAYILYNMYQIYTSDSEKSVFIIIMMILLSVISAALVIFSVKNFIMGEYVGGKADKSSGEEKEE